MVIPEHSPGVAGGLVALGVYGSEKELYINFEILFLTLYHYIKDQ